MYTIITPNVKRYVSWDQESLSKIIVLIKMEL